MCNGALFERDGEERPAGQRLISWKYRNKVTRYKYVNQWK